MFSQILQYILSAVYVWAFKFVDYPTLFSQGQGQQTLKDPFSPDSFTIVHRETQGLTLNIKEAMYIWVNDSSLNRNLGKYQVPHIWDHILQDTSALQLK